jgi:hypothetical protein
MVIDFGRAWPLLPAVTLVKVELAGVRPRIVHNGRTPEMSCDIKEVMAG